MGDELRSSFNLMSSDLAASTKIEAKSPRSSVSTNYILPQYSERWEHRSQNENTPPSTETSINLLPRSAIDLHELQTLKETIGNMQKTTKEQTKTIAEQTVAIQKMYEKLFADPIDDVFKFPLKTFADLLKLNESIESDSTFEANLKILISKKINGKISNKLNKIISDELLQKINWDGRKKMEKICDSKFFNSILYSCLYKFYDSYAEYEKDMKESIKRGKNRLHQRKHVQKRHLSVQCEARSQL